ncbi:hypothetical protein EVG20_g6499 [Dentipellis fragilis]|uniref:Uncharacterized protein n=1 Tax=Dentipellis fragilis TaxID=205917 RepID=A0A4Y9YPN0_9AGAM|nr:hypothetical protein EVG20_g6499 [Dentipellis fragilis]
MSAPTPTPTEDECEDVLLASRYGDLDDVKAFVARFGTPALAAIRGANDTTILHMVCANGHTDLLEYLLPIVPASLLSAQNASGSTPLHWAALNSQLEAARKLVEFKDGPGVALIDIKNAAGHSPLGEAELAGWEEGAKWMVEVMNLEEAGAGKADEDDQPMNLENIEVEIEDADGRIAKMSLGDPAAKPQPSASESEFAFAIGGARQIVPKSSHHSPPLDGRGEHNSEPSMSLPVPAHALHIPQWEIPHHAKHKRHLLPVLLRAYAVPSSVHTTVQHYLNPSPLTSADRPGLGTHPSGEPSVILHARISCACQTAPSAALATSNCNPSRPECPYELATP